MTSYLEAGEILLREKLILHPPIAYLTPPLSVVNHKIMPGLPL